jgi:hypothetical protein
VYAALARGLSLTLCLIVALPSPAASDDLAPRSHALLIGINKYIAAIDGVPELRYASKDAEELGELLAEQGYDARVLLDDNATRVNIVNELSRLAATAAPQDTVLIYFAGHGVRLMRGREQTFWLTYASTLANLPVDGIRLNHLLDYIEDIQARRKILILDHCHSGDAGSALASDSSNEARAADGGLGITRSFFPLNDLQAQVEDRISKGLVILGAARNQAYEFDDLGHGLFTSILLDAARTPAADTLNKDGILTLEELRAYIATNLTSLAEKKQVRQDPIEIIRLEGPMSGWNILNVPLDDMGKIKEEAVALRDLLTRLEVNGGLDFNIKLTTFIALTTWEQALLDKATPAPRDEQLVVQLRMLRDLAPGISWTVKSQMFASFYNTLMSSPQ